MYAKSFRSLLLLAFVALLASACTELQGAGSDRDFAGRDRAGCDLGGRAEVPAGQVPGSTGRDRRRQGSFLQGRLQECARRSQGVAHPGFNARDRRSGRQAAAIASLTDSWNSMSADLPNMVNAIQSRVDTLSKSKKLPKNLDQASFDAAKTGLDDMKSTWSAATQSFNSGNVEDAVAKAKQVQRERHRSDGSPRDEERSDLNRGRLRTAGDYLPAGCCGRGSCWRWVRIVSRSSRRCSGVRRCQRSRNCSRCSGCEIAKALEVVPQLLLVLRGSATETAASGSRMRSRCSGVSSCQRLKRCFACLR